MRLRDAKLPAATPHLDPKMDTDIHATLQALEESLWRAETRFDDARMGRLFAEDFLEFGRSGRIYTRDEMLLGNGATTEIEAVLPLPEFRIRKLSDEIYQVLYVSKVRYGATLEIGNRSSLWRRKTDGWELCFHQGTPANDTQAD